MSAPGAAATAPRWFSLGPLERIPPGEGRTFVVGGLQVAVFHLRGGGARATQATCPHQGGPLADGLLAGTQVVCPLHAFKFDLCDGRALGHNCAPLQTYEVRVDDAGQLLLALPDGGRP